MKKILAMVLSLALVATMAISGSIAYLQDTDEAVNVMTLGYVYIDGTEGDGAGFGTVSGDTVYVRSGPGTNFDALGSLNAGTNVDVLFQIDMGEMTWGCIKYGNGYGWISMTYVGMG